MIELLVNKSPYPIVLTVWQVLIFMLKRYLLLSCKVMKLHLKIRI